jgi:hypothetical protein
VRTASGRSPTDTPTLLPADRIDLDCSAAARQTGSLPTGPCTDNQVRAVLDRAPDEMIYIGPDHPYYPLLADLVSAVGDAWQQRFEQGRLGSHRPNPYTWARRDE